MRESDEFAAGDALREVNVAIDEMRREHDPLASHRNYRRAPDTKSGGKRRRYRSSPPLAIGPRILELLRPLLRVMSGLK